jgi:hypothetical protein
MKFATALTSILLLVACGARSSDEEQVREVFASAEIAAENRDASDVLEFVADDYEDSNGFDKSRLRDFLRAYFLAHPKIELIVDIETLEFPADGVAHSQLTVTSLSLNDPDRQRLRVELRRQDGEWRVSRADRM